MSVWDIQGFEKFVSKFLKALDNLLSQNREEQVERGSFKIMRIFEDLMQKTKQLHCALAQGTQIKPMDEY